MMCPRVSVVWAGSIVLLLLVVIGVDAQQSYLSDAASNCKQQYRTQCLKKNLNRPPFKDPICVKHTICNLHSCTEDYYTYPKGACGMADLCWNPTLTLVKNDVCDYDAGSNGTKRHCKKRSSKYQFYRRLAEKLPCPRSGERKVRDLQYCSTPYECAMQYSPCYDNNIPLPDQSRSDLLQFCYKLCVTKPKTDGCAYYIYFTYTSPICVVQDKCWEPGLFKRDENDFQKHCGLYAMKKLGGELLRGRVRYDSSRPFVFGRDR